MSPHYHNYLPLPAKVLLSVLVVCAIFITLIPTEFLTTPCTRLNDPLISAAWRDFRLTPWSFRGVSTAREGAVGGKEVDDSRKSQKVELEIHIMSKCPDAQDCMEELVFPALRELGTKMVDFKMSFIGKIRTGNGGVACMHGPGECLGNMVHLCGAKLYPYNHTAEVHNTTFIPFSQCLIHDYEEIPGQSFIEECAKKGKVDFQKINECLSDPGFEGGIELLRSSVEWSEHLGVQTSCTVRLAGKRRCVRDGGKWRDCEGGSRVEDLVRDVKAEYDEKEKGVEVNADIEPFDERYEEYWRAWLDAHK